MNKILIVGYGEMGHAMEHLLKPGNEVVVYDPGVGGKPSKTNLSEEAANSEVIVFCTPTEPLNRLAVEIGQILKEDCICLTMAKALNQQGNTAYEALKKGFDGSNKIAVLYGPMIAEDILLSRPAYALIASSGSQTLSRGLRLFAGSNLKLKPDNDANGAAWCAVLKNAYAMLFGIADELELGDNVRGFLSVEVLSEMANIVSSKQGKPKTPYTLAGLGDLITTATSNNSHHHELGVMLAHNDRSSLTGEGVNTLHMLDKHNSFDLKKFPLLHTISSIVVSGKDASEALKVII